jgi:hypothetical protein
VLLGLDAGYHPGGPARHHDRNPAPPPAGAFDRQAAALATLVAPLRERGVEILNATPGRLEPAERCRVEQRLAAHNWRSKSFNQIRGERRSPRHP